MKVHFLVGLFLWLLPYTILSQTKLSYLDMIDSSKVYQGIGDYATTARWLEKSIAASEHIDFSQYAPNSIEYQAFLHAHISLGSIYSNFQRKYTAAYVLFEKVWLINTKIDNQLDMSQKVVIDGMMISAQYAKFIQKEIVAYKRAVELCQQKVIYYTNNNMPAYKQMTLNEQFQYVQNGIRVCQVHQVQKETLFFIQSFQSVILQAGSKNSSQYLQSISFFVDHYTKIGDYTTAQRYISEGENILTQSPNLYSTIGNTYFLKSLAFYYKFIGNHAAAIKNYLAIIDISKKMYGEGNQNLATFYHDLALIYTKIFQYKKADQLYNKALLIYGKLVGPNHKNNYQVCQMAQIDNNIRWLNNLLLSEGDIVLETHADFINQLEVDSKKLLAARAARFGKNHVEYANTLILLSNFYKLSENLSASLDMVHKALLIREQYLSKNSYAYRKVLFEYAAMLELTGDIELAARTFREFNQLTLRHLKISYAGMSEKQRNSLLHNIIYDLYVFNNFVHRHIDNYPELSEDLLNNSIVLKGLSLETNLDIKSKIIQSKDSTLSSIYEKWIAARNQLVSYEKWTSRQLKAASIDINELEQKIEQLATQLAQSSSSIERSINTTLKYDYQSMRKQLKKGEVAIEFIHCPYTDYRIHYSEIHYYALIVRWDEPLPILVKLGEEKNLQKILKLEITPASSNYINDKIEGEYLYDILWQPLEYYLDNVNTIYLSPSGILHKVAFNALLKDYITEERLLESYDFHYLSSMRDFFLLKQQLPHQSVDSSIQITLVGGVKFDPNETVDSLIGSPITQKRAHAGSFSYLYGTQVEVNTIEKALQPRNQRSIQTQKLLAAEATEQTIKGLSGQQAPNILHIASHGFFFEKGFQWNNCQACKLNKIGSQPPLFRSGIALANANANWAKDQPSDSTNISTEDGILSAYEVSNMNLSNTSLVILSACETGRGDISNTEGVMGLQRAFKIAGCDKMILSLWKVPDKQTAELMTYFYQFYAAGDTIDVAFKKAQLKMLKQYDNPYYWAAFVLTE